jgi:hypothetical protein
MLDKLQSTDFSSCLEQLFQVRITEHDPVSLELVAVTELGAAHVPGRRRPFALLFLGAASPQYLAQGTYQVEHDVLGRLDLFIVPLGAQGQRMRYEAIFN